MTAQAVLRALRPEERVRGDDVDMVGEQFPHEARGLDLHRSDVENQRSRPKMGRDRLQHVDHFCDGDCDHHHLASRRLGQPGRPVEGGIENTQGKVRREAGGGQATEGAEADQAE